MMYLEPVVEQRTALGRTVTGSRNRYALNVKAKSKPFDGRAWREFEKGNRKQRAENFPSAIKHLREGAGDRAGFLPGRSTISAPFISD